MITVNCRKNRRLLSQIFDDLGGHLTLILVAVESAHKNQKAFSVQIKLIVPPLLETLIKLVILSNYCTDKCNLNE